MRFTMRCTALALAAVGLQACTAPAPVSNAYGRQADAGLPARLNDGRLVAAGTISTEGAGAVRIAPAPEPAPVPVGGAAGGDPLRTGGIQASPGNAAPTLVGSDGRLSDEQSFDAVSARETIESDAQRRAAQAAQYEVIQPGALPTRGAETGPNIVQYALSTRHNVGQRQYRRVFASQSRMQRNCAGYPSHDAAQRAFLGAGGPQRDRFGMDPDGDGFACGWNPAPYRLAASAAVDPSAGTPPAQIVPATGVSTTDAPITTTPLGQ